MIQILHWRNWGCVCPHWHLPLKFPIDEHDNTDLNWTPQDFALLCSVRGYLTWPFRKLWAALGTAEQIPACRGRKKNLSEQLLTSKTLHVWGRIPPAPKSNVYSQGKKEDDAAGHKETPGVFRSSPAVLLCPKGISDTACSEQHWMLPLLEKVPWLCVQHQSMALYNFFLSRSLKIHSLLFREMQCENLQNNHFLFR